MAANIINILIEIINSFGYLGIFVATGLEYACFPVSSELLLPFIGYTVSKGELNIFYTILVSTAGGVIGCTFCYLIGRFFGDFINATICKRFKSAKIGIDNAKNHFNKYGCQSVMVGRVFPIVRTYISIPAGMAKMNFFEFIIFSGIGALVWNTLLISIGFFLGEHWSEAKEILNNNKYLLYFILASLIVTVIYFAKRKKKS